MRARLHHLSGSHRNIAQKYSLNATVKRLTGKHFGNIDPCLSDGQYDNGKAEGADAAQALAELEALIENKFGEE